MSVSAIMDVANGRFEVGVLERQERTIETLARIRATQTAPARNPVDAGALTTGIAQLARSQADSLRRIEETIRRSGADVVSAIREEAAETHALLVMGFSVSGIIAPSHGRNPRSLRRSGQRRPGPGILR